MSTPDPEQDFEGFCVATLGEIMKQIEAIPESERAEYFVMTAAARLYKHKQNDSPAFFLEHEKRTLMRRLADLPVYYAEYEEPRLDDESVPNGSSERG